ncbi:hypothetical protein BP6252_05580 [Coleophoma cylindrospora]|uniref:Heterokaryon incompatibility domain-containing protein n=1 Tax=Coleophoma cylindrospora TaxID=1849047 RepID=A0A3D8RTW2_9HELO|nr:hypothetical protein BP6252_05580 [Coleophoma cylindrospora]
MVASTSPTTDEGQRAGGKQIKFCENCEKLHPGEHKNASKDTKSIKISDVVQDRTGCVFCKFLSDHFSNTISDHEKKNGYFNLKFRQVACDQDRELQFPQYDELIVWVGAPLRAQQYDKDYEEKTHLIFGVSADYNPGSENKGPFRTTYLGNRTDSNEHLDSLKTWIKYCQHNHPGCYEDPENLPFLPSRCLHVGKDFLRLRDSEQQGRGRYMTLSHCWGPKPRAPEINITHTTSTTTSNLEDRKKYIDESQLPLTFRNAISLARQLSIDYIWIDSLCIIQHGDLDQEKGQEMPKMGDYYSNAHVTVAATFAENGKIGCFSEFSIGDFVPLLYDDGGPDTTQRYAFVYTKESANSKYAKLVENGHLLRRGWTLQEWLLSRRIVHYANGQVFFACRSAEPQTAEGEAVTNYFKGKPQLLSTLNLNNMGHKPSSTLSFGRSRKKKPTLSIVQWYHFVNIFSRLSLTQNSDRLDGVLGIAVTMEKTFDSQQSGKGLKYLRYAGLWSTDMHFGLLWENFNPGTAKLSNCKELPPTWSWAALTGPVAWFLPERDASSRNACQFQLPMGDDKFLTITGKTKKLHRGPRFNNVEAVQYLEHTGMPYSNKERFLYGLRRGSNGDLAEMVGWCSLDQSPASENGKEWEEVQALHILTRQAPGGLAYGHIRTTHDVFVVLLVKEGQSQGVFKRIGIGRIWQKGFFRDVKVDTLKLE